MNHFLTGTELSQEQMAELIRQAILWKKTKKWPELKGKTLTLFFANPSLRTRLSFESGMKKMGGEVNVLDGNTTWQFEYREGAVMNGATQEHIKEAARVISCYSDLIGLRASELITTATAHGRTNSWENLRKDQPIRQLARYAEKPVINMESNMFHPCQGMADMMTLVEHFGDVKKKKCVLTWVPHPKALPLATPHSQMLMPAIAGMHVTIVHPEGFPLDDEVMEMAKRTAQQSGGTVTVVHDQQKALHNADVVVAKSWASLDFFAEWEQEQKYRKKFTNWTVTQEKMKCTNNAVFMHCLPVRRNVEVTDGVLDGPSSLIIEEAENRMWIQMSIISYLLSQIP